MSGPGLGNGPSVVRCSSAEGTLNGVTTSGADAQLLGAGAIRRLAQELDVRPAKRWGQNFVVDANTVRRIVRIAGVGPDEVVVEVGPGLGSLTLGLLETGARVLAVEIDATLAEALPNTVTDHMPGRGRPPDGRRWRRTAVDRPACGARFVCRQPPLQRGGTGPASPAGPVPVPRTRARHGAVGGCRTTGRATG